MEVDFYSVVSMPQMKCILIWSKSIFYKVIYFADFVNKMRGCNRGIEMKIAGRYYSI